MDLGIVLLFSFNTIVDNDGCETVTDTNQGPSDSDKRGLNTYNTMVCIDFISPELVITQTRDRDHYFQLPINSSSKRSE